jgi:hypothetical protein
MLCRTYNAHVLDQLRDIELIIVCVSFVYVGVNQLIAVYDNKHKYNVRRNDKDSWFYLN